MWSLFSSYFNKPAEPSSTTTESVTPVPTSTPDHVKPLLSKKPYVKRSKDLTEVKQVCPYLLYSYLSSKLLADEPIPSPNHNGTISLLVERPDLNARHIVQSAKLTRANGMQNSGWELDNSRGPIDQICVMSTAAIRTITNSEDPNVWAEAGDQIFMDFELGNQNLKTGDLVQVGPKDTGVLLEVSIKPHTGCCKFSKRYGDDALKVVANKLGKERRLRGIYFIVVKDGVIETGDKIVKLPPKVKAVPAG